MTYLLPDDWYANHGLAPGDARGRQPVLQPRPGNIVTSPIMRGYYGRRPVKVLTSKAVAFRPFMDTDAMWGVNGLHGMAPGLGAQTIQDILDRMKRDMKKLALEQAAASTAITISLNAVPIVGTAASIIYAAVQTVVGVQNQKKAQEILADTNNQVKKLVSDCEFKTAAAQSQVFDQELAAGTTEAMACQGMHGLGSWGSDVWGKVKTQVVPKTLIKHLVLAPIAPLLVAAEVGKNSSVVSRALSPATRADAAVESSLDTLSGAKQVDEASKTRTRVLAQTKAQLEAQYQQIVANMNTQPFRDSLRNILTTKLLDDSDAAAMVRARCGMTALQPGQQPQAALPSGIKGGVFAAAGVTAAIVAFVALGGHH